MTRALAAPLTGGAALAYAATCMLGAGTLRGAIPTRAARGLHHVLFVTTAIVTVAAAAASLGHRPRAMAMLVPAGAALARLTSPTVRPGSRDHARVALSAAPSYVAAIIETVRG